MSIRRTLLASLLAGLLLCAIVITLVTYFNTAHEMHELLGDSMKRMATVIKEQVFVKNNAQQDTTNLAPDELEESSVIQIWDGKGKLLHSSPQEIELPLQPNEGFGTATIHGQKWKIYTVKADNDGFVQIAQPRRIVATMISENATRTLIPFAILFALLGIGAWLVVGKSLAPLSHLSKLIASREIDKLKPLSTSEVPNEVQPIVRALNELLKKLDQAMTLQRQFTADAAHELRTPLAAIKIQADLLSRAQFPAERSEAMKRLAEGIERSINLAAQLLNASRSAAAEMIPDFRTICLDEIIRSCIETYVPIARAKNIHLVLERCDECTIEGDEEGIRMLINNLIDNAIRYTPIKGRVRIGLFKHEDKVVLKVEDTGNGIPQDQRTKIFQRFYRIPGTPSLGAGLGLSIVKDIANNHNATVLVTDGSAKAGTMFRVIFPSHPSDIAA